MWLVSLGLGIRNSLGAVGAVCVGSLARSTCRTRVGVFGAGMFWEDCWDGGFFEYSYEVAEGLGLSTFSARWKVTRAY